MVSLVIGLTLAIAPAHAQGTGEPARSSRFCNDISYYGKHYPVGVQKGAIGH